MKRIYFAVFLVSSSALMFEVSLTRLFSIHLWYHFSFMVISIAMLGTGSAGTVLYLINRGNDFSEKPGVLSSDNYISSCAALSGVSFLFSYIASNYVPFDPARFSWEAAQIFYFILYCTTLSIPFFFTGIMIASVFVKYSNDSPAIYGYDLLGAGFGSILVIIMLNMAGPEYAVLLISSICLIGAMLIGNKYINYVSTIFILVNVLLWIIHPSIIDVKISPYKNLPLALTYPGATHIKTYHSSHSRIDTFKSPLVRFAPGLSLNYLEPLPDQTGIAIDGNRTEVVTFAGNLSNIDFIDFLPSSLGYEIAGKNRVLVIDPKGGLSLLTAGRYGFQSIHGVESNPLLADIMQNDFNEYSGGIYTKNIWTGFARNFLVKRSTENHAALYDLIDIPVEGTSVGGIFGIPENYKYTYEAFEIYLNSLSAHGILSINLYLAPPARTELRILSTIINVLNKSGVIGPHERIAAIRSWDSMTLLVKNSDFISNEISRIKEFARNRSFDLVYYPGMQAGEGNVFIKIKPNKYRDHFNSIINQDTASAFIENYLFDITPVHDDNPFFHYFLKLRNIYPIYKIMGQKFLYFIEEGYLLPVILIVILTLSSFLIIYPVLRKRTSSNIPLSRFCLTLVFFSTIGIGFMFIEVTLIQKCILLLEDPSLSLSVVLAAILISSGAGSLFSARYQNTFSLFMLLMLCLLIIIYNYVQPLLFSYLAAASLPVKISVLSFSMFPLGFLMGIPFPTGMRLIGCINHALIPWAWAVNACFSVLSPVLVIMLAISAGFQAVMWFAVIAYMIALFSLSRLIRV